MMTPNQLALAQRLGPILTRRRLWLAGMRIGVVEDGNVVRAGRFGSGWGSDDVVHYDAVPDLECDVTAASLAVVARLAWNIPTMHADALFSFRDGMAAEVWRVSSLANRVFWDGPTETDAWCAAIGAAP